MAPGPGAGRGADLVAFAPTPEAMKRLGAALASVLAPGDTVLLGGDLGAGKTTFTQGLADALGAEGPVTSPTFVLVHSYRTRAGWDLVHADVWRLEQLREVVDLAIPELQEEGAAAVVEWGERAAPALSADCLHVAIDFAPGAGAGASGPERRTSRPEGVVGASGPEAPVGLDVPGAPAGPEGARRLVFTPQGPSWQARMARLADALAAAA